MTNTTSVRLGLSLMIVVCFWASPLHAQQVFVVPTVPYEPAHHAYEPLPLSFPQPPAASPYAVQRCFNSHGMGCQVDPFYPLCSNLQYELRFAFGSCRSFFGESCPPSAPCGSKHWGR
jgi:hypothetical protein